MEQNKNELLPVVSAIPVLTKGGQKELAEKIVAQVENGEINPLYAAAMVKGLIDGLQSVLKDKRLFEGVQKECEKFGKEKVVCYGASFQICETGVKYDFEACGDPVYDDLSQQKVVLEEKIKERTTFLKGVKGKMTIVDDATGEVVTLSAPVKTSSTGFKILFAN